MNRPLPPAPAPRRTALKTRARARLGRLWRRHRGMCLAFLGALVLTLFFAAKMAYLAHGYARDPRSEPPLAGWMTAGYVAHGWKLPKTVLAEALDLPVESLRGRSLAELARARGESQAALIARLTQALIAARDEGVTERTGHRGRDQRDQEGQDG